MFELFHLLWFIHRSAVSMPRVSYTLHLWIRFKIVKFLVIWEYVNIALNHMLAVNSWSNNFVIQLHPTPPTPLREDPHTTTPPPHATTHHMAYFLGLYLTQFTFVCVASLLPYSAFTDVLLLHVWLGICGKARYKSSVRGSGLYFLMR